jgi:hypothetical protein
MSAITVNERAKAGASWRAPGRSRGPASRQIARPGRKRRAAAQIEIETMANGYPEALMTVVT